MHRLFEGDLDPGEISRNLSIMYNIPVEEGKTLLFFDEIQACIPAISSIRFFYEKFPGLHLIAAGSLLEFALQELPSFGVGRIRSLFVHPFSFDEFLQACGEESLLKAKLGAAVGHPLSDPVHQILVNHFKRFLVLGGMPEVVAEYARNKNFMTCQQVLQDIIISLKSDFAKYRRRVPSLRIQEVFESVVQQNGGKFVFSKTISESNHKQIKEALELLILAGLVIPVTHTSAQGLPLGSGQHLEKRKMLIFDTGIFQRLLGLDISSLLFEEGFHAANRGAIAELFVGLEMIRSASPYQPVPLYYWHREALNSNAEVDYLVQQGGGIVPVEVKSGTKGSMQSMFLFLKERQQPYGIRCSLENFATFEQIRVYPLYAVSNFMRDLGVGYRVSGIGRIEVSS